MGEENRTHDLLGVSNRRRRLEGKAGGAKRAAAVVGDWLEVELDEGYLKASRFRFGPQLSLV